MKYLLYILLFCSLVACNKFDTKPNRLSTGAGVWQIDNIVIISYDSLSNVLSDSTLNEPGEILVMDTDWGTSDTRLAKYIQTNSSGEVEAFDIGLATNGNRLDIDGSTPIGLEGLYSVSRFGFNKQVWVSYVISPNQSDPNVISQRKTVSLTKRKSK